MSQRRFAISIDSLAYSDRELYVGCRIVSGAIAVDDTFNELSRDLDESLCVGGDSTAVSFRVVQIVTYHQSVSCLNTGFTGELKLESGNFPRLAPRDYLVGSATTPIPAQKILGDAQFHVLTM